MPQVTFDIDTAPQFGQRNPELYFNAFGIKPDELEPKLDVRTVTELAMVAVSELIPHYNSSIRTLEEAVNGKEGGCKARACLFLTLVAPFQHISKGIELLRYEDAGNHWFNVVSARQDFYDAVIDSYAVKSPSESKVRSVLKLKAMSQHVSLYENYYGGVKNAYDLLIQRRHENDFDTNEHLTYMVDDSDEGTNLRTVYETEFTKLSGGNDSDRPCPRVIGWTLFNEMAVAVVDAFQGDETTLADDDLNKQIEHIYSDGILKEHDERQDKASVKV